MFLSRITAIFDRFHVALDARKWGILTLHEVLDEARSPALRDT
jgi:hypothetical protein